MERGMRNMNMIKGMITAFAVELHEIKEECNMSNNLNCTSAHLIALLNKYAVEIQNLSPDEQQKMWCQLHRILSPGIFIFNKDWDAVCRNGCRYIQKMLK